MRQAERGFLLLGSHLGDPERKVLTGGQMRTLAMRIQAAQLPVEDRDLCERDLIKLGYGREMALRIVKLLNEEDQLDRYLQLGKRQACVPVTRISKDYPLILRQRLGLDSPGCLWAKGDLSLLSRPGISLVGSRELREENREFAREVGRQAARQGLVLISGNARGADREAQNACLEAGGQVISIVADELTRQRERTGMLYLSEEDFESPFTTQRALSRNRCIHALGRMVFVAQSDLGKGGTWDGTGKNLRYGWSPVACFRDGSEASRELEQMGAYLIGKESLGEMGYLAQAQTALY